MTDQPKRRKLVKVSIGPYLPVKNSVLAVNIKNKSIDGRTGGLKDPAMGFVRKKGESGIEHNFAKSIGRMGSIAFNEELLSPVMRDILLTYLGIYKYDHAGCRLIMKDDIIPYIEKYKTYTGFRRLKYVSKGVTPTNPWKKEDRLDSIVWNPNKNTYIPVSSSELKRLLSDATSRYRRSSVGKRGVSIEDLCIQR